MLKPPKVFPLIIRQNKENVRLLGRDTEAAKQEDSQDEIHSGG